MKVSKSWLQQLVDLKVSIKEVERLLPLRTITIKEITDSSIELDMKGYNRADLLSMRGVAYEVAAVTDSKVKFNEPSEKDHLWVGKNLSKVKVKVEDEMLCPLYCVAKVEGLQVKPSNPELIQKLANSGIRSVNNIADITNIIMLEYGQPLHAFDARGVKDEHLVVRRAKQGEKITTLDGKIRDLETSDLLIADPQNNLGIAGVMGGKDSEISDSTNTILLEAAIFDPSSIRKTAQRLGLQSEASKRFYHGLTKKRLFQALDAAIKMYQDLGGKLTGLTIVGESEDQLKKVPLTLEKVRSLIGVEISGDQVEEYLKKLNFEVGKHLQSTVHLRGVEQAEQQRLHLGGGPTGDGTGWVVTPPYWRLDIEIEEDLIEEVARMIGFEKIPSKELEGELPGIIDQSLLDLIYNLKKSLVNIGLTEVQTYSFYSTLVLNNLNYDKEQLVKIANPISSETEYMRNHLWPNLVETVVRNVRQGFDDIAIFEIGKIYWPQKGKLPEESYRLTVALLNGSENPIQELSQIFKNSLNSLKLEISFGDQIGESEGRFHPTRHLYLTHQGKPIGKIGEVHPRILNHFGVDKRVAILEMDLEPLSGKPA